MKKFKIFLQLAIACFLLLASCKKLDNRLTNPNLPAPATADVDLYLNYVQISFSSFYANNGATSNQPGLSENGEEMTRMEYMASRTYKDLYGPGSFDGAWRDAYQNVFKNVNALIPIAQKSNRYIHTGMAKVIKAYTAATLVDYFGDVPYKEANLGIDNTNPAADPGRQVYDSVFALLDDAIADFNKVTVPSSALVS